MDSKLMPFLSETGVFVAQVTLMLAAVLAGAAWLWTRARTVQPAESPSSGGIMWVFLLGAAFMLLSHVLRGRLSRKLRWELWEWPSFSVFQCEEQRLQVLGVLSLMMLAEVAALAASYVF